MGSSFSMENQRFWPLNLLEKNYCAWEFQFQLFVKGKHIWGHMDVWTKKPINKTKLAKWDKEVAQIMRWIVNYVDPHIVLNLHPYKTVADMWGYLK